MVPFPVQVPAPALYFPVGITGFTGVTSRNALRAMFPPPRQENFYSQREKRKTGVKHPGVYTVLPVDLQNKTNGETSWARTYLMFFMHREWGSNY